MKRDRSRHAYRFSAKVSQVTVSGKQLEALAKEVSDGALSLFISHLVQAKRFSKQEKSEIHRLLEE